MGLKNYVMAFWAMGRWGEKSRGMGGEKSSRKGTKMGGQRGFVQLKAFSLIKSKMERKVSEAERQNRMYTLRENHLSWF